jgi:large subunit ribosomal protein L15
MQIHDLRPKTSRRGIKRIGRGGKRGTYSGRGQKGQKSRAGRKMRPGLRDTIIRTPKLRGFKNKPKSDKPIALRIERLNNIKEKEITREVLEKYGIKSAVKIVGGGELKEAKNIVGIKISASAKKAVESVGGSVTNK